MSRNRPYSSLILCIILCSILIQCLSNRADAQSFTSTSVILSGTAWNGSVGSMMGTQEVRPLTIVNASPIAQPISFYAGANGASRIVEMSPFGEMWVQNSLSIGAGVGAASSERMRIGRVADTEGRGLVVGMAGTNASSGIVVEKIGFTGTEHAGIVLSGASNGTGTALRIGGPQGSSRPTVATAIDITGGTGLRYNALNLGGGTGIDVGGTLQPQIGIECAVAGTNSVGVIARSNTTGMGIVGISKSAAYADPPLLPRVGVHGHAANNSNTLADSTIGVVGSVIRGGNGGTSTRSTGVYGIATSVATSHSGLVVGVYGQAAAPAPGVSLGVAGLFHTDPISQHLTLFTMGGDVYLGGVGAHRPSAIANAPTALRADNPTTTWMHSAITSGNLSLRGMLDVQSVAEVVPPAGRVTLPSTASCVMAVDGSNLPTITGLEGGTPGRIISLVVREGTVILAHDDAATPAEQRFSLPDMENLIIRSNGSALVWYDIADDRWRLIAVVP